jgi:glycosyltransferase involved in cell wall biosynthesis
MQLVPSSPHLSVIVPFFNEEDSIEPLHAAIVNALTPLGVDFEMVFVDDGSVDSTIQIATALANRDPRVRVIKFRRNYGQTPAMAAGIEHARGEILVTMDGDLQNDPADIALFLEKMAEGFDIVVGWRYNRQDKLVSRKLPSKVANWLIGKVTGVPIKDNGCSLKAYRASLIKAIPLYSEMHRFIPAMASIAGHELRRSKCVITRAIRPIEIRPFGMKCCKSPRHQDCRLVHCTASAVVQYLVSTGALLL